MYWPLLLFGARIRFAQRTSFPKRLKATGSARTGFRVEGSVRVELCPHPLKGKPAKRRSFPLSCLSPPLKTCHPADLC
jgi:hypothetical protein